MDEQPAPKPRKPKTNASAAMPKRRPKFKYKPIKKPKPPRPTAEQRALKQSRLVEARYKINPSKVCLALLRERGLISNASKRLRMSRDALTRYIEKNETCLIALGHARDTMGDIAEGKLYELIEQGDVRCILYYLSTVHRHRGYGLNAGDAPPGGASGSGQQVFVDTVNIVGVPSGTYLPPPEGPVIDG
jgi:hypothetical protein